MRDGEQAGHGVVVASTWSILFHSPLLPAPPSLPALSSRTLFPALFSLRAPERRTPSRERSPPPTPPPPTPPSLLQLLLLLIVPPSVAPAPNRQPSSLHRPSLTPRAARLLFPPRPRSLSSSPSPSPSPSLPLPSPQIAKNLVLAGFGATLQDSTAVAHSDLGANFFLTEADVGKNRAAASLPPIQELNPLVKVRTALHLY